jgi:DNA-binding winged helix-turn-helix (wHTH) protein
MTTMDIPAFIHRIAAFEIDAGRFELRESGRPVAIEKRPLELILYLAWHRERLVSKEELIAELWACRVVSDASLRQAVASARRALQDRHHRIILTVRGKGFRFKEFDDGALEASSPTPLRPSPTLQLEAAHPGWSE